MNKKIKMLKKPINLALKSLILNNKKKKFYAPELEQSRNTSLKTKNINNTSINNNNKPNIFIKKFPSKTLIISTTKNSNSNNNINYNSINTNSINKKFDIYKKINSKKIKPKDITKNKSYHKFSIKNIIMGKYSKINKFKKNLKQNENNNNNNKTEFNNINYLILNNKNNNTLNNKDSFYQNNKDNYIRINKNNNTNNDKNNNKNYNKEKKIFGIKLKKKSTINNNFINHFNEINNNYYLYEKNLGLGNNLSRKKSYKTNNNSGTSLLLKKNITCSNSNKLLLKKKLNFNNTNSNINDIIIDYYNYDSKDKINNYKCNNSECNMPHLNKITINNYNYKNKKPIKLNLVQDLPNNKIHILQNNNNNSKNNTINITIDNSVNNIYTNYININKNTKITYIKVKNNNSINNSKNLNKNKIKKNTSKLFPKKIKLAQNDSMNHSYQNIIINYQKRTKTKEKKNKKLGEIIKENLKKIHEKRKKKQLLISLNNAKISKAELFGIQEIFSNFSKIKTRSPKFGTPKISLSINNFNKINFSGRFNRTEDKNIDFYTSMTEKYKNKNSKIIEDPQYVYEYFYEILNNLLIDENNYFEKLGLDQFNLIKNKNYINPDSRKFFINSLINIQELLNFTEHTLFLTTQIFDRYINNVLMKKNIKIKEENLDIVIVTSLIIAAKNEEIKLYSMVDYLNLLPLKYNIHDLEKTEYEILSGFDFNLNIPCLLDFYEIFSIEAKLNKFQRAKGLYLLNFILLDSNLVQIPSSLIAYAIIYIVSGKNILFNKLSEEYINNGEKKIIKIISILKDKEMINNLCGYIKYLYKINKNSNYNAPYNKFNSANHYFISSYLDI